MSVYVYHRLMHYLITIQYIGVRHGTDVLKALALGARAVFIGRPVLYGIACNVSWFVMQCILRM